MTWLRRRKRDIEEAAGRIAEAEERVKTVVDSAARFERLKAEIAIYTMRPQKGQQR